MPELAEVERSRRLLQRFLAGRVLTRVQAEKDDKVIANLSQRKFVKAFKGASVVHVHRKGKHIIVETAGKVPNLYFHQGMTGAFSARNPDGELEEQLHYKDFKVDASQWPPRFHKVVLTTDAGAQIAFTNSRRFGKVLALENLFDDPKFAKLGPDPFLDMPAADVVAGWLLARKAPVKGVLLDQGFLAGIGNWIADEVLYQARVHPSTRGCNLKPPQISRIIESITYVVHEACKANANHDLFPAFWLFHHRWANKKSGTKDFFGNTITFTTVAGRTAGWVGKFQSLTKSGGAKVKSLFRTQAKPLTRGEFLRLQSPNCSTAEQLPGRVKQEKESASRAKTAPERKPRQARKRKTPLTTQRGAAKQEVAEPPHSVSKRRRSPRQQRRGRAAKGAAR